MLNHRGDMHPNASQEPLLEGVLVKHQAKWFAFHWAGLSKKATFYQSNSVGRATSLENMDKSCSPVMLPDAAELLQNSVSFCQPASALPFFCFH